MTPDAPKYGLSALAITSVLLLAAAAGVIGWLALGGGLYQDRFGRRIPVVTLPLPSLESVVTESAAPAQPVEPGPPPAAPKETAKASPEAPPKAAKTEESEKSPADGATPPEKTKAPAKVEAPVKAEIETATPEPPAPAKTPPKKPPKKPAKKEAKKEASKASQDKTPGVEKAGVEKAAGEKDAGETAARPRPSTDAAKATSPVPGPPTTLSNIITRRSALTPAPDPGLTEKSGLGLLPIIGDDGRKPWLVYARGFDDKDRRPRIALVIVGLGLSEASTQAAIQRLPGAVTLAFVPYAKTLDRWIPLARAAGHEVLLTLPMEPDNYPADDPGPHALLTSLAAAENLKRLHWVLSRTTGYVGVINNMGSRFTTSSRDLDPVLAELKRRGLMFVDSGASLRSVAARMATRIGLARAINNRFIDVKASRQAIDQRLAEIERIARTSGHALGVGTPYPVTFERVARWLRQFDKKGLILVPVSALANKQPD